MGVELTLNSHLNLCVCVSTCVAIVRPNIKGRYTFDQGCLGDFHF